MTTLLLVYATVRRAIREKALLLSVIVMALLMIGIGSLESAEAGKRTKLILDFGSILLDFFGFALSLLIAHSFVVAELSTKQSQLWLSRPISRQGFLVAKWL